VENIRRYKLKQESNQKEAAVEQPEVASQETTEATPEVTSTEAKETSERPRTEDEFRKIQSLKGKAEHKAEVAEQSLQSVQAQLNELQTAMERQRLEARRKEIEGLEGDPEAQKRVISMHELEDQGKKQEKYLKDKEEALVRKYNQATELAATFNVPITELLTAETPREMELMAQVKGAGKGVKAQTEGFVPDSGVSETGTLDKKRVVDNYIKDPYNPENVKQYQKIRNK